MKSDDGADPRRILILTWNFPPTLGGIEYVMGHLHDGLAALGRSVRTVAAAHPRADREADRKRHVLRAPRPGLPAFLAYAFFQTLRALFRERPDAILCGTLVPALCARPLAWLRGVPYVVLVHGSDVLRGGALYQAVVRWTLGGARFLCTNSEHTRQILEDKGFDPARLRVVHPGVDVRALAPSRCAEEKAQWESNLKGRFVVLGVGRLIRRKGFLEFIEQVMPRLREAQPEILFLLVGEDAGASLMHKERMKDQLAAAVARLGLENHVRLLGSLEDRALAGLLHRTDLFVMPCLQVEGDVEGFGIVFMEAALGGAPSVATRVGGIPDAVVDGETGLLVEPGDPAAMADAILRLVRDPELRARLAAAAARRARASFSWEAISAAYDAVLAEAAP
jgi:phosphatidyl-myo-inositol dimannoside synthase